MALGLGKLEDTIGWLGPPFAAAHTHAPQLIDAGVDVVTISKRLAAITSKIYAHLFRKDAAAINAVLASAVMP